MSDLAPFVAAVLRDRVIKELMDENQRLREENEAKNEDLMVRVTGQNGTPCYFEGFLMKRYNLNSDSLDDLWYIKNRGPDDPRIEEINLSCETFSDCLEFRLGEMVLDKQRLDLANSFAGTTFMCLVFDHEGPISEVAGSFVSRRLEPNLNFGEVTMELDPTSHVIVGIYHVAFDISFVMDFIAHHCIEIEDESIFSSSASFFSTSSSSASSL